VEVSEQAPGAGRLRRGRLAEWRSPAGQPRWARPAQLLLTAAAGLLYGWRATGNLEVFYAAAVRSMSMSWHNFFFAAFDPSGTVSVDKLPGALWLQALSVRVFGLHAWAIVAPQVAEGMLTLLLLFRVVRRLAGALAALVAALALLAAPATVALDRGNISDTLMVLLLLVAADATVSALESGRMRSLVLAGVAVGLAFQAKMVEAWLVLPALALAWLLAARCTLPRRALTAVLAGLAAVGVSLSYMAVVSLWPAASRPYVDGSSNDSIFSQVFVYNGFGRLDQPSPNQLLSKAIGLRFSSAPAGWSRLLSGAYGRDTGWLIPAALAALLACLIATWGRPRQDLLRAGGLLFGGWLVVFFVSFSASSTVNAYYCAALSPALAALLGIGVALAWERRELRPVRFAAAATVAASCAYAAWLLPAHAVGTVAGLWLLPVLLGAAAVAALLAPRRARRARTAYALALLATLALPLLASVELAAKRLGPFDTPFESPAAAGYARALAGISAKVAPLLPRLEQANAGARDLFATQTSALAAPFIYDSGKEVLPIGGFSGTIPEPTLASLRRVIAAGELHTVIQAVHVSDPRLIWVSRHCLTISSGAQGSPGTGGLRFAVYYCGRLPGLP
jgi:4-amino-4-deoxy-L-arabinose transferase-like glycosyltransferase